MLNQAEWIKVVTHPIGIAAFALFLVFLVLTRTKKTDERRWLTPAFVILAIISLLGGFLLTFQEVSKTKPIIPDSNSPVQDNINVQSHGNNSRATGINYENTTSNSNPSSEQNPKRPNDKAVDAQK